MLYFRLGGPSSGSLFSGLGALAVGALLYFALVVPVLALALAVGALPRSLAWRLVFMGLSEMRSTAEYTMHIGDDTDVPEDSVLYMDVVCKNQQIVGVNLLVTNPRGS